jgi:hypothetical protein
MRTEGITIKCNAHEESFNHGGLWGVKSGLCRGRFFLKKACTWVKPLNMGVSAVVCRCAGECGV